MNKPKKDITVSFIGSGNVATHLAEGLFNTGVEIVSIWSLNPNNSKILADRVNAQSVKSPADIDKNCDFYIISIPDDKIEEVAKAFPTVSGMVVHTSGMTDLKAVSKFFNNSGVFYPLQTFSKERAVNLKEVPFCLEVNLENEFEELKRLALLLSDNIYKVDSEIRKYLHLSAVFVSNFVNYLYYTGEQIVKEKDVPFDILKPLIKEVALKVMELKPEKAQTGPARRKDVKTIEKHEELLKEINEDYLEIYKLLTEQIIKRYYEL